MDGFWGVLIEAVGLILTWDPDLIEIIGLSLRVTLTAVAIAWPDRVAARGAGGCVLVSRSNRRERRSECADGPAAGGGRGLVVYLALSAAGPLGPLGLLYTPTAR